MKKTWSIFFSVLLLTACAGNPPAWWNPRTKTAQVQPSSSHPQAPVATELPPPTEEDPSLLPEDTYEEMTLTPLQDEEGENASGDSSAQSVTPIEQNTDFLPPPSVLTE